MVTAAVVGRAAPGAKRQRPAESGRTGNFARRQRPDCSPAGGGPQARRDLATLGWWDRPWHHVRRLGKQRWRASSAVAGDGL